MEKMNHAFEKMKMLVGMDVEDEHQQPAIEDGNSFSFMDDFTRECSLTTKQVSYFLLLFFLLLSLTCFFRLNSG